MRKIIPYFVSLFTMLALDAVWLSLTSTTLYRADLAPILIPGFRLAPALAFYLLYALGIQIFAVTRAKHLAAALGLGAAFGIFAYGTYDLTNWATLRDWNFTLTITDITWGAVLTSLAAAAGYATARGLRNT